MRLFPSGIFEQLDVFEVDGFEVDVDAGASAGKRSVRRRGRIGLAAGGIA